MLIDRFGRKIEYLRISITDRCNFHCIYCARRGPLRWIPHEEILRYEEILTIVKTAVDLGVRKVRITGGEPLLRKGVVDFIAKLAKIEGITDLSLTTNGYLLVDLADKLKLAGLHRINVSLDTLDSEKFEKITGGFELERIWAGILKAQEVGFYPIKINVVVIRGVNDEEILSLAELTFEYPWEIRFIEFMPVGNSELWDESHVMPISEIRMKLEKRAPLKPISSHGGGPAKVYQWEGALGRIGLISPLSEHFCGSCNRFRITADGKLRTCLFSDVEIDLKPYLRERPEKLSDAFIKALTLKPEKRDISVTSREMRAIGG